MSLKKLMSILCMLAISLFVFTACESDDDPVDPPPEITINVLPVETLYAGQSGKTAITVMWDSSKSKDSSWFTGYELTISASGVSDEVRTFSKNDTQYEYPSVDTTKTYTFSLRALGENADTTVRSSAKTIQWACASHFTTNDVGAPIRVYVKESASYGSGLNLYDAENAPSTCTVGNGAKWNLAVGTKGELIFGTASSVATKVSYNLTGTPADAEISISNDATLNADVNTLDVTALNMDLSGFSYSKQYIDLNGSVAASKTKGLVLFAKLNNHYAKIIVLKENGKYLQDENSSDPYIKLLVSYQTRSGVPYAKPTF